MDSHTCGYPRGWLSFCRFVTLLAFVVLIALTGPVYSQALIRVSQEGEEVVQFLATSRNLVFVSESGTYRIFGLEADPVLPDPERSGSHVLARVDNDVWIGSRDGLFKLEGGIAVRQMKDTFGQITTIESDKGRVWIAEESSLPQGIRSKIYSIDGDTSRLVAEVDDAVTTMESFGGRLWIGTENSVYRIDEQGSYKVFSEPNRSVEIIVEAGGETWLITTTNYSGYFFSYRWSGNTFKLIEDIENTTAIIEHDGHAWLAANQRIYRYAGGEYVPVRKFDYLIKSMDSDEDELVVVTSNEIYRGDILSLDRVWNNRVDAPELDLSGISYTQEHVWIWGAIGLYRFDPDTQIHIEIKSLLQLSEKKHLIFGNNVLIKSIRYRSGLDGSDPYSGVLDGRFGAIVETNTDLVNKRAKQRENFSPWRDLKKSVSFPSQRIVVRARDVYGNASQLYEYTVYVLPKETLLLLLVVLILLIASVGYRWIHNCRSPPRESPLAPTPVLYGKQRAEVQPDLEQEFDCMISYSHEDKVFVDQLHERLKESGISCWRDRRNIPLGGDIDSAVSRAISRSRVVLLCCSENSLKSTSVQKEIDLAIKKKRYIIPLKLDRYLDEWIDTRADYLRKRWVANFTGWERNAEKFERTFKRVVKDVRAQIGR